MGPCKINPTAIHTSYLYVQACSDLPSKDLHDTKVNVQACSDLPTVDMHVKVNIKGSPSRDFFLFNFC